MKFAYTAGMAGSEQEEKMASRTSKDSAKSAAVADTVEAWDDRTLGASEEHVVVADRSQEASLDEALGLQAISIRLPKQMIEQYKLIAHFHGVGYQPLMRDVLSRFVPAALREILETETAKAEAAARQSEDSMKDSPMRKAA